MRILLLTLVIFTNISAFGQNPLTTRAALPGCVPAGSYVPGEWIFWSPDKGALSDYFQTLIAGSRRKKIKEKRACSSCDEDIRILSGDGLEDFMRGQGPGYSKGAGSMAASGKTIYYSRNFIIQIPHNESFSIPPGGFKPLLTGVGSGRRVIEVAVFDTGIDPSQFSLYSTNTAAVCNRDDAQGWNFVDSNSNVIDNHPGYHGSWVTQLIIDQVVDKNKTLDNSDIIELKIRPVKVLDSNGHGNLFNLLCGFAYARKAGIKIINASLGFYSYCGSPPEILTKQVEKLRADNILLITAAGNKDKAEDIIAERYGVPERYLRNLDYHHFYPAGLSKDFNNVICITTAGYSRMISRSRITTSRLPVTELADRSSLVVSPRQNYSSTIVNVAVLSDSNFLSYGFLYRLPSESIILEGSSFATPIFTGRLVSSVCFSPTPYHGRISFNGSNRNYVLDAMQRCGDLHIMDRLGDQVQGGRVIKR